MDVQYAQITVGFAEPANDIIAFNFHINLDYEEWTVCLSCDSLVSLEHDLSKFSPIFKEVPFPSLSNDITHKIMKQYKGIQILVESTYQHYVPQTQYVLILLFPIIMV